jgi:CheY-like chemotaxis protein
MINEHLKNKNSLRIMVVDDNIDGAETLSLFLELEGHTLSMAHDGMEAVKLATGFKPQVIFLDIGMPGMNGYETAEEIRRISDLEGVILVAVTGWDAETKRIESGETGFDYYFTKPTKIEKINTLLSTLHC